MKYVVTLQGSGLETPIIIPETMSHNEVVEPHHKVIGAGFCRFAVDNSGKLIVNCWGQSVTLKVKSRLKEDEELILAHNEFIA